MIDFEAALSGENRLPLTAEEVRAAVLEYEHFYHVTTAARWERIAREGLVPGCEDPGMYSITYLAESPPICLTPGSHPRKWVGHMRERFSGQELVRLEVPAAVIAPMRLGVDYTSNEWRLLCVQHRTTDFRTLLAAGLDVVCLDPIPVEALAVVERLAARRRD